MKLAILAPNVVALSQPSAEEIGELADRDYRSIGHEWLAAPKPFEGAV